MEPLSYSLYISIVVLSLLGGGFVLFVWFTYPFREKGMFPLWLDNTIVCVSISMWWWLPWMICIALNVWPYIDKITVPITVPHLPHLPHLPDPKVEISAEAK